MAYGAECLQHWRTQVAKGVLPLELAALAALHDFQPIRRIHPVLLAVSPIDPACFARATTIQASDPGADPYQSAGLDSGQHFERNHALALFPEARDPQQLPACIQLSVPLPAQTARKQIEWIRSWFAPTLNRV